MFLTEGSTQRRAGRVLSVTLGPHPSITSKPFESARTARGLRPCSHAIWSERSTHYGAQSAMGRAKKAAISIGERYATGTISVFRAAREG